MEQLSQIIQQVYWMLKLLSIFSHDESEELVGGYHSLLSEIDISCIRQYCRRVCVLGLED